MMRTATAEVTEFNEGTLVLGSAFWFCTEHSTKMRVGKDCAFCAHERMSDTEFDQWVLTQRA